MNEKYRPWLQVLLPLVVVGLGVAGEKFLSSLKEEPTFAPPVPLVPIVGTVEATRADVQLVVQAQGVVQPRTETTLVSEVDARVIELSPALRDGGTFEADQVLLRLDDTDLRLALEESQSRIASAELMLVQEEADAEISLRDWRGVHGDDPAPPLVAREPQLARARAELEAAQAAARKAQRDVERTVMTAPYPGRVRERLVDVGTYVTRGRDLARIYSIDAAEIRLPVPDEDLASLDLSLTGLPTTDSEGHSTGTGSDTSGPRVRLEADFAGGRHAWEGRIVRTSGAIDPKSRMVVLVAEVDDPYGLTREGDRPPLVAGLFVDAWIEGRVEPEAVTLPREALRSGERVFVLDEDERLSIRSVDVVRAERDRVVLRDGIAPGERVIVTALETPAEGMQLELSGDGQEGSR